MGRTATVPQPGGGTLTDLYWMATDDGQVGQFEITHESLVQQLTGERLLKIIGYTDTFEIQSPTYGPQKKLRVLFEIMDGPEAGGWVALMLGDSLGEKAHFRHIVKAARKADIAPGEEFNYDSILGLQVYIYAQSEQNDKGYWRIYYKACREFIEPTAAQKPAAPRKPAAPPTPKPAAQAAPPSYDPFIPQGETGA